MMIKDRLVYKIVESEKILDALFEKQGSIYTFLNPVSYLEAQKNVDLFTSMDSIFSDGVLLVDAIKILYGKKVSRNSFDMTSIARRVFDYASDNHKTMYFVGTTADVIDDSIKQICTDYPKLNVVGYRNGYFLSEKEQQETIKQIVLMQPDFLVVGMGIVRQEQFLILAKKLGFEGVGFSCGGFLHQYAINGKRYYPEWIDRYNLRFLYRMYKEPHTVKRYAKAFFVFPIVFLRNYLKSK